MLYEVITVGIGVVPRHVDRRIALAPPAAVVADARTAARGDAGFPLRITSYNVCYTKLLRAAIGGSMGGMQVLQFAAAYPERVLCALPIASYNFV